MNPTDLIQEILGALQGPACDLYRAGLLALAEKARRMELIEMLCTDEGDSVELVYPSPSSDGPDHKIIVVQGFGEPVEYCGATRDECVDQAITARFGAVE